MLSKSQRYSRENEIEDLILLTVVSNECIKKFGLSYLNENSDKIAAHISTLVDNVKLRLEKVIRCDIVNNKTNIELPPEEQEKLLELDERTNAVLEAGNIIEDNVDTGTENNVDAGTDINVDVQRENNVEARNEVLPKKQKKNHRKKMMESKGTSVGALFLKASTKTDYHEIRLKVIEKFRLTKYNIPTYHYMTMHQPKFDLGILEIDPEYALINR